MKNITTPRTLADATFTTGYVSADCPSHFKRRDLAHAVALVAACLVIGICIAIGSF